MITTHTNKTAEQVFDTAKQAIDAGQNVRIEDGTVKGRVNVIVNDYGNYTK